MRLSICATAFTFATLLGRSIAAPTIDATFSERTSERRDEASDEALKYFHEPGCVAVIGLQASSVKSDQVV